jgi:hypothetical protein
MVNTAVDTAGKEETRKPRTSNIDFRISESTKKRLSTKTQAAGAALTTERKSTVDAALGKILDDGEGGTNGCSFKIVSAKVGHSYSTPPPAASTNAVRKRPSVIRRVKDDLGTSEHSSTRRRRSRSRDGAHGSSAVSTSTNNPLSASQLSRNRGISKSEHNPSARRESSTRVSRTGDESGKLGSMLDQMSDGKPKKKGAKSVVSLPAETRTYPHSSGSEMTSDEPSSKLERIPDDSLGEEDLKNEGGSGGSVASMNPRGRDFRSGRKKTERELAVSPGPLTKKRSESPGTLKKRTTSPGKVRKRSESLDPVKKRSEREILHKNRAASPGPLKKRTESPGALKKRSESSGSMKKRAQSPGVVSKRKGNNESCHKMRSERVSRPGDEGGILGDMLNQVSGGNPKKKGARSVASAPVQVARQAERRPSVGIPHKARSARREANREGKEGPPPRTRSVDSVDILSAATEMGEHDWRGSPPEQSETREVEERDSDGASINIPDSSSESSHIEDVDSEPDTAAPPSPPEPARRSVIARIRRSFSAGAGTQTKSNPPSDEKNSSHMRNEIAKQRVKRNNSMGHQGPRDDPSGGGGDSEGNGSQMKRAQSMMLHREMTRRAKSNSLADLVQYKEEEIHSTSYFASNHVLINRERMKRGLRPLTRNIAMDEQARKSAEAMATSNGLNPLQTTYVGNVLRGESIRSIHRSTMQQKQGRERMNLLNPYFQDFGVGTAKGEDGMLYMCQLFSERLELALTDTTST